MNKTPRSTRQIREQLADLAEVKASTEAYGARDAASKMALQSIYAHEKELLDELRAAELLEAMPKSNGAVQASPTTASPQTTKTA